MKKEYIVIIGAAPQSLFMNRLLSNLNYNTIIIASKKNVGYYSKYGKKIFINTKEELILKLKEISKKYGKIKCHLTSGPELYYLTHNFSEIYNIFDVYPKPLDAIKIFSNKLKTYKLASETGIAIPLTSTIRLYQNEKRPIKYPCILKWNVENNMLVSKPFKTYKCNHKNELERKIKQLPQKYGDSIILQQYIDSPQSHNFSYLAYYEEGTPIFGILVQQIRQYPMGITSSLREFKGLHSKELIFLSQKLVSKVHYTGFCEVEFMVDFDSNQVFLLEVNPRTCGWISALEGKFCFKNKAISQAKQIERSKVVHWMHPTRDLMAIFNIYKKEKKLSKLLFMIIDYLKPKVLDVFSLQDMKPIIFHLIKSSNLANLKRIE